MSAKFLHGLSDDPQVEKEIQKQIGCMAGFLQLFDRHQILTGKKFYGPKRIAAARAPGTATSPSETPDQNEPMEATNVALNESSASSRISSLDCNDQSGHGAHPEAHPKATKSDVFNNSINQLRLANEDSKFPLDIRDVVRDSFQREPSKPCLESRLPSRNEANKHRSPPSKEHIIKVPELPARPRREEEHRKPPLFPKKEEVSAFPHDCRDIPTVPIFEYKDAFRSSMRQREPPRLSLDSRASMNADRKSSSNVVAKLMGLDTMPLSQKKAELTRSVSESRICYDMLRFRYNENGTVSQFNSSAPVAEFGSNCRRQCPNSKQQDQNASFSLISRNKKETEEGAQRPNRASNEKQRNPVDSAPCSYHPPQSSIFERWNSFPEHRRNPNPPKVPEALYAELDKKLQQSGLKGTDRELETLKQFLEAMHLKRLIYSEKDGDSSYLGRRSQGNGYDRKQQGSYHHPAAKMMMVNEARLRPRQKEIMPGQGAKSFETAPIGVVRAGKFVNHAKPPRPPPAKTQKEVSGRPISPQAAYKSNSGIALNRLGNEITPAMKQRRQRIVNETLPRETNARRTRSLVSPTRSSSPVRSPSPPTVSRQRIVKSEIEKKPRNSGSFLAKEKDSKRATAGSVSPRPVRQVGNKKIGWDKTSRHPPINPNDKERYVRVTDDDLQSSSILDEASSNISESNISRMDMERPSAIDMKGHENIEVKSRYTGGNFSEDPGKIYVPLEIPEHPSPVSVLDSSIYKDDESPPPFVRRSITFPEREAESQDDIDISKWNKGGHYEIHSHSTESIIQGSTVASQKETSLVDRDANLETEEVFGSVNYSKIEYSFIADILLTSGLLEETDNYIITFHSSGFPVDPEIFFDLEEKYSSSFSARSQKSKRKPVVENINFQLIFDCVNDILYKKLSPYLQLTSFSKIQHKRPSGDELLQQVLEEYESLPCIKSDDIYENLCTIIQKDLAEKAYSWSDLRSEFAGMVLDIERMLFKDLIDETISDLGGFSCRIRESIFHRKLEFS